MKTITIYPRIGKIITEEEYQSIYPTDEEYADLEKQFQPFIDNAMYQQPCDMFLAENEKITMRQK